MINELYELSKSLEQHRLLQSSTHRDISNVAKVNCVVFELGNDGMPCGMRYLQEQQTAALWKHSNGNHKSFPAIRLQHPLLALDQSEKVNDVEWDKAKIIDKIRMITRLDCSSINPYCSEVKISEWTIQQLQPVIYSDVPELAALKKLVYLFPRDDSREAFLKQTAELVKNQVTLCQQSDMLNFFKEVLIGVKNSKTGKAVSKCMIYFDFPPSDDFNNLVASNETQQALIKILNTYKTYEDVKREIVSPFSGTKVEALGNKYPNPNIPLLGITYLYSKKSDTPCLTRYNMSGVDAFQTGKLEISAISDALAFLIEKSRENKTWGAMRDSNKEKPDLLLAYLPDDPQNNAYLAKLFGNASDYEELEEFRDTVEPIYDALCQQVLGAMKHILQKNRHVKVNLLLLETLDPGRKQVVYESSFTVEKLRENMFEWGNASKNIPPIVFKYLDKKELKKVLPICLGPMEICQLLKISYTHSGSSKLMKQSEVSLHKIYSLYMPPVNSDRSVELLNYFLERSVQKSLLLLGDIGCQMTLEYPCSFTKKTQTHIDNAAKFVTLLSILLYFKDIRKETYMSNTAFNIGQFLKLSDMLHKEYCIQVRNSGNKNAALPSQLMGNELLAIAAESPIEGLNRLRERMKIYLAWANTVTGENSKRAKSILEQFEDVSLKIAEHELPERFDAAEQAQVLLGYLATISYEKKSMNNLQKEELK